MTSSELQEFVCINGHYVLPTGGQLMCALVASKTARFRNT